MIMMENEVWDVWIFEGLCLPTLFGVILPCGNYEQYWRAAQERYEALRVLAPLLQLTLQSYLYHLPRLGVAHMHLHHLGQECVWSI